MSTILIRRDVNVAVSAAEAACEFLAASADVQAAFLVAMIDDIDKWTARESWPFQCRAVVDEIPEAYRVRLAVMLGTLVEHLRAT